MRRRLLIAVLILCAGSAAFFRSLDPTLHTSTPSHLILDRTGRFLGEVPGTHEAWGFWPLPEAIPEKIVITTLETEDRHFEDHPGVHLPSVARAAWQNVRNQKVISGASTIPMQVARLQHPRARTLFAKLHEAAEALLLVHENGRDAVLRQYLTIAPYGKRCHGVGRAARLYFDKPVEDLSWLQAAYLAALPQQPGKMTPWTKGGHALALTRARRILLQLHERGILSDEDLRIAQSSDLHVVPQPRRAPETLHAVLALQAQLAKEPGFLHHATLDLEIQRVTHRALVENLSRLRAQGAGNTAGLVVDLPTGEVLAYVGSADYFDVGAHGAIDFVQAKRSPGSSLKPFIYGMALEKGSHTAATELADTPVAFELPGGGLYLPENITHTWSGPMLLKQALGNSRNIPALRVLSDVGVDQAVARFDRGGVAAVSYEPDAYGLALAIGALHVTPWELATLYTALANRGETIPLKLSRSGPPAAGARLLSTDAAMLTARLLADPEARRPAFPPGGPLDFDYAVAIKTGTSQGYRDAWATAFSDRLLIVTWVGNHDWRRMHLASGGTAAAPALHRVMDEVMPTRAPHLSPALEFPLPPHASQVEVCALSGRRPGPGCTHVHSETFLKGTEPTLSCPFHVDVALDVRNGLRAGPSCPARFVVSRPMLALPEAYAGWARSQRLTVAPTASSPLCPAAAAVEPKLAVTEPRPRSRYLVDPNTPPELNTVRFAASVTPADEEIIWLVDDTPVAKVGYPHELRWSLAPGRHVIRARLARSAVASAPVTVTVDD